MIQVERVDGEITAITINGEKLGSDDGERWFVPKSLLKGIRVNDLPEEAVFEVCSRIEQQ